VIRFRVHSIVVGSVEDERFAAMLRRAQAADRRGAYPVLRSLQAGDPEVDPEALLDEIERLSKIVAGTEVAATLGALRDDLMEGLAAAEEG
jgi:hypothetical protein